MFLRTLNIGPRERDLIVKVAEEPKINSQFDRIDGTNGSAVIFPSIHPDPDESKPPATKTIVFDGGTHLELQKPKDFDLTSSDWTIVAHLRTTAGGTIFATANEGPKWTPDGQSLFIRDGRLCFDIGWVGAVTSNAKINDGRWHTVAASWQKSSGQVRLYIDGRLDREGKLAAKASLEKPVVRLGYTTANFPQPESFFHGDLSEVRFYRRRLTDGLKELTDPKIEDEFLTGRWKFDPGVGDLIEDTTHHGHDAKVQMGEPSQRSKPNPLAFGVAPAIETMTWITMEGHLCLKIPAGTEPLRFSIWTSPLAAKPTSKPLETTQAVREAKPLLLPPVLVEPDRDLAAQTKGGPPRWPQRLETSAAIGADTGPFAVDFLTAPESNPWLAQLRFTGLDFFADGRIALCTWDGDVWIVEPVKGAADPTNPNQPENLRLRWQRVASGLFQPLGLKIVNGLIHLICRDQLAVLHDLNDDGETDFYECLNNDHQVTEHFHEFAMGLQTDAQGNFYYAKSGRHALAAVVPHHGTLLRVRYDGSKTDILATGFRAANGVCLNPDGSFVVTDQEGFWNPKNRINWVTLDPSGKPRFYGNMFGYHDVTDSSDEAMEPPLCWITNAFDRSPAELLWVDSQKWGPLNGSLLNLSYGYGKVYVVPFETVRRTDENDGRGPSKLVQGGMCELPLPIFPTGIMRGRFHPVDGQLYTCGMFAWAGNATQPGGFYRIRATGRPAHLPIGLLAGKKGMEIRFSDPVDPQKSLDPNRFVVRTWSLKRSANYGSNHYDEKELKVASVSLSDDQRTVSIELPEIQPTWCMSIEYKLIGSNGELFNGLIHNTIHALGL